MKTIAVKQFCVHYDIPISFIDLLSNYDLIETVEYNNIKHIQIQDINRVEKLIRLHYDLEVNFEGLDVINNLITQINSLQEELIILWNRIDLYE